MPPSGSKDRQVVTLCGIALQKLDTPVVKSLASMKGKDQIRRVIEDSIEPALKTQALIISVIDSITPFLIQLEAAQNAADSALIIAQKAIVKASLDKSIEPKMMKLQETVKFIEEDEKYKEELGKKIRGFYEELARSKRAREERIQNLEQRMNELEKGLGKK